MSALDFGIVANSERTELALGQFCRSLSLASGVELRPCVVSSYEALSQALLMGDIQLGWTAPLLAVGLEDRGAAIPLVVVVRGVRAGYHSALFVRSDSPHRRLEELDGLTAAWVSRQSASGYFVPRWHLASLGVDVQRAFRREIFCASHEEVVEAVASGSADIGATHVGLEPLGGELASAPWIDLGMTPGSMRVLLLVGPIPGDLIVASPAVPVAERQRLTAALLGFRDDHDALALALFQATRFEPAPEDHLALLRRLARFAAS
ncbi:MAG: PhnD/SsuA/transferrin family substrate-binding protein [Sorangiineae bacterium]|nr:PhnD/SsuA/transferrin family substrate-binding protein [Polyangiaceae bacterium]MEB2321162.1 PhnD/SsuA/transferrin family substrate-binding protein [Sorangiineae bacterium]